MTIRQEAKLKASVQEIYEVLTDAKKFSAMCGGAPTEIVNEAGGVFSCFGGMILGRNIELVPNQRIVQAWRVKLWPAGVYSLVKFELTGQGSDTQLVIEHTAFPEGAGEHLAEGWKTNYIEPLKKYLAK